VKTLYCAFNVTRQSFISIGVTVAGTPFARLRGLLGKMRMRSDEAVWVVPSHGIHTIGLRFAIDVLYLDAEKRVVYAIENLRPLRIPPMRWNCASVLELPARSIFDSGTRVGDQLLIRSPEDLNHYWESQRGEVGLTGAQTAPAQPAAATRRPLSERVQQWLFGNKTETG
jgi:uncharacterized membrane protein (UPF0127 family)